ncbi:MAG: peptidoglycan-binding protein [Clostridia bacterium]|nr:peptidoglycan-binding protein [Clostridia bacterium]
MEWYNIKDREPFIMQLQKKLRSLSKWTQDPSLSVAVDGIYGNRLREAVSHFQELYGLDITGVADFLTWESIDDEYRYYAELFGKSRSLSPFPDEPDFSIGQGDRSDVVLIVQLMLNELRIFYDLYGYIHPNGRYGTATSNAVREFQRLGGLDMTGRVDRLTWNRLAEEYNVAVKGND